MDEINGYSILRNPRLNKSTAFTPEERKKYGLTGLIPDVIESLETQILRVNGQLESYQKSINKYTYLMQLLENNETLFFFFIFSEPAKI